MFIVKITKEGNLEKALKQLKNKVAKTGMIHELRDRQSYTKPSVERRNVLKNAKYRQNKFGYRNDKFNFF
jgi:small subunit ribosomal protein S21